MACRHCLALSQALALAFVSEVAGISLGAKGNGFSPGVGGGASQEGKNSFLLEGTTNKRLAWGGARSQGRPAGSFVGL